MVEHGKPATLLLIDCQKGFDHPKWGERNNPEFINNITAVIKYWREKKMPIIHIRHASTEVGSPLAPHGPGYDYYDWAAPIDGEIEVIKQVNSGFIGTQLKDILHRNEVVDLVICGLTTNHCVSTTVRMAGNFGFNVELIGDACATFPRKSIQGVDYSADLIHDSALASLHGEFCTVVETTAIINGQ